MIVTVHKYIFVTAKPRVIHYRCYKDVDNISFRNELRAGLSVTANYNEFDKVNLQVLNNHAPMKSETVRTNHAPYMRRSYLEGKYYKTGTQKWGGFIESKGIFAADFIKKKERNVILG